jgi:hypothetical protein
MSRERGAGSREQGAEHREQGAESGERRATAVYAWVPGHTGARKPVHNPTISISRSALVEVAMPGRSL